MKQLSIINLTFVTLRVRRLLKSLLFAPAILLCCTNCSLDQELYGALEFDSTIKNETDAEFVVNGVFSTFQGFDAFKASAGGIVMYSGDDFSSTSIGNTGNAAGVWINRMFTSSNDYVRQVWRVFCVTANRANSAREAVNAAETLSETYKRQIEGEMLFARAFSYYYLVRLFGGVPIRTEATEPSSNFFETRASVDSVYALIFADLKRAANQCLLFKQQPETQFGRPTKGAAHALLASAYLTYGNYCDLHNRPQEAQMYYLEAVNRCDSVINSNQYRLLDNYADLYDVEKERDAYQEVIYGIHFTRDFTVSGASSKGSELAYYTQPATRRNVCGDKPKGAGSAQVRMQPWFFVQYISNDYGNLDSHDYRTDVSFLSSWVGYASDTSTVSRTYITFPLVTTASVSRQSQPYLNKYADGKGLDNRNHENDFYVIRYSEIFLIKAEALNELDRRDDARIAFNVVRERARKADGTARTWPRDLQSGLSKADFRLAVFNERGLELVGEGHRFFDCVRTRYKDTNVPMLQWRLQTFYPSMSEYQRKLPVWDSTRRMWDSGRVQMINVVEWHERFLLYPIPTAELDANPNFGKQNPGW
jgi:hypothetical protein